MKKLPCIVRLRSMNIESFKCVAKGRLVIMGAHEESDGTMCGIYGATASGKTTAIDALDILSHLLSGKPIPARFTHVARAGGGAAEIEYIFRIHLPHATAAYDVVYRIRFRARPKFFYENSSDQIEICSESVAYLPTGSPASHKRRTIGEVAISDKNVDLLRPRRTYNAFHLRADEEQKLADEKKKATAQARSFLFSSTLRRIFTELGTSEEALILNTLAAYGKDCLVVLRSDWDGSIPLKFLPGATDLSVPCASLDPNNISPLVSADVNRLKEAIGCLNEIFSALIPDVVLILYDYGTVDSADAKGVHEQLHRVAILTSRDGATFSLHQESSGIRRLISLIPFLSELLTNRSCFLAVDDLDRSLNEYLFGEILGAIAENVSGQFIFTAQSMRGTETAPGRTYVLTTPDPTSRYMPGRWIEDARRQYYEALATRGRHFCSLDAHRIRTTFRNIARTTKA